MAAERLYWLGFSLVKGVGPTRFGRLLAQFGSMETAWHAADSELAQAGLDRRALAAFRDTRSQIDLKAEQARLDRLGIALLTWNDDDYPPLLTQLREINQAPPVLYMRGTISDADDWGITVVGTRSVSAYGRQVTRTLARDLVSAGLTIISGLARGVDAEAHEAALESGGRTTAVLPCGLDQIYPPEHRRLAARIMQAGALLSPFPPGTVPDASKFPVRNRIMSGLARAVLVTEAGDKSGALMTASAALEQGREVFAVPGNITTRVSQGVNRLIQDGAHPVLSAQDVIDVLDLDRVTQYVHARAVLPETSSDEQRILKHMSGDPIHIDELARQCGLPVSEVNSTLMFLQLKGLVREVGTMTFVRE